MVSVTPVGLEAKLVIPAPLSADSQALQDRDLGLRVADSRHVREHELLLGQQARREDRQGGVLVARGGDLPREGLAAFDHEFLRHVRG